MALKVLVNTRNSNLSMEQLHQRLPSGIEIREDDDLSAGSNYEILVNGFPTRQQLEASSRLRAVIAPFAGVPKETLDLVRQFPHISLHVLHYNVAATAELAVGLMLAAAKCVIPLDRELRNNDWRSRYGVTPVIILDGRTVTILGYGRIGQRIGAACRALGMKVFGVRRHVSTRQAPLNDSEVAIYPPSALNDLLPRSDVLIVALPLTSETKGLIGRQELALLPEGAILVNVGRGPVVDEDALYEALCDKKLLGAGIDVWYQYPNSVEEHTTAPPSSLPFHTLDNVIMSPHRGGYLSAAEGNRIIELAAMLTAAAEGQPIPGMVDKELGY